MKGDMKEPRCEVVLLKGGAAQPGLRTEQSAPEAPRKSPSIHGLRRETDKPRSSLGQIGRNQLIGGLFWRHLPRDGRLATPPRRCDQPAAAC